MEQISFKEKNNRTGKELKALRSMSKQTQAEVAAIIGISRTAYVKLEQAADIIQNMPISLRLIFRLTPPNQQRLQNRFLYLSLLMM